MLGLFFPDRCTACDVPLFAENSKSVADRGGRAAFDRTWCDACWGKLDLAGRLQCKKCAAEIRAENPLGGGCPLCRNAKLKFDRAVCLGNYADLLRDLVIAMKNQQLDRVAIQLGALVASKVRAMDFSGELDLVLPVPTHWRRRLGRGFCAAEILAEKIASNCEIEFSKRHLKCTRQVQKQGRLSIAKRAKNILNAFEVSSKFDLTGKNVLLVDDVMTSGATASELAKRLKKAGAESVYVAVVARGAGVS
jgi:ComF family protein